MFYDIQDSNFQKDYQQLLTIIGSLSLDRIDVNGDYTPRNCRWITMREQQLNKRTNRKITICEKTKCLCEWLKTYKIHRNTFYYRLKKGYSKLEAITGEKGI